jgi:lipopolysaccharide biosynthesis glycosyltransferase
VSRVHVACAAEGPYVAHSAALLHSVLEQGEAQVHYLHGPGLPRADAERLAALVPGISLVCVPDERIADLPDPGGFTRAMWYRLLLPDLLEGVDRVLYLDVDTIVTAPLEPLWRTRLEDAYVAAVTNVFEPWYAHRPAELGLAGPEAYFNSGVLLMNLSAMRRDACVPALRDAIAGRDLLWPDQDALNLGLGHRRVPLHPRWNAMNSVMLFDHAAEVFGAEAVDEARRSPAIRHFEGPSINKPWHPRCRRPHRELYRHHRQETPWRERRTRRLVRQVLTAIRPV